MPSKLNKNNLNQKLKPKVITNNNWPSEPEIEEVIKETSQSDYPYANYILPDDANATDRAKYKLCQDIIKYQQENKLSESKLIKKLGISKEKLIDILFSKIYSLDLEELITYTDNLQIPFEVKITNRKELRV